MILKKSVSGLAADALMGSMYGLMEKVTDVVPLLPSGLAVAMESLRPSAPRIRMKSLAVACSGGLLESVALAVKLNVPF